MSLEIDIDPHGIARLPFAEVRDRLYLEGMVFSEKDLSCLHYYQLRLAAMANAGNTVCSLEMVVQEKRRRRSRFVSCTPEEFSLAARYLSSEAMLGDVKADMDLRQAISFEGQPTRVQLFLVLNCIRNHTDLPAVRLRQAGNLAQRCLLEGVLGEYQVKDLQWEIEHMVAFFPHGISGDEVRAKVAVECELLLDQLPEEELASCVGTLLSDYSCTSDCYRPS